MALVTTRALILQAFPYSETSKILRIFTWDEGLRSVIAKGAQRPKSRYGGLLEPFTEGNATFHLREGRDLHTLSGFDLLRSRQALGRDLLGFAGASLLSELAIRYGTEEPNPALFRTLVESWDRIVGSRGEEAALEGVLTGVWRLVALLGFEPVTDACVICSRELEESEPVRFDSSAGGTACTRCRPVGRLLDPGSRGELREMAKGITPAGGVPRPGTHRALLRAFLEAQLAQEHPLRSLELFLDTSGGR